VAVGEGTRKRPWAASGALSSAFSTGIEGRGSSARSAFSTLITCDVGGTSSRFAELLIVSTQSSHLRELLGEAADLLLGQLEAGEAGDVEDLVSAQHSAGEFRGRDAP
jgi:hypothetical protein